MTDPDFSLCSPHLLAIWQLRALYDELPDGDPDLAMIEDELDRRRSQYMTDTPQLPDLDALTCDVVANTPTFQALLDAEYGYRPTFREDLDPLHTILADYYDEAQNMRGDPRRSYRPYC